MPELALDDVDRDPFSRELDGVGVAQLVRGEPASDTRFDGELAQFSSSGAGRPPPPAGGAVDHSEQRPGRQQHPVCRPRTELLEPERVHPRLAALVALAMPDQ